MSIVAAGFAFAAAGCGRGAAPRSPSAGVLVLPEYYAHSVAALGFPGMRRAFQAGHGSQLGAGDAAFEWRLETAAPAVTSPVYFEADGVPVAHWWMTTATDSVHFEAAALAVPGATDTLLVASVRIDVRTRAGAPSNLAVRMVARDELSGPHFRPWDALPAPGAAWTWESGRVTRGGLALGALGDAKRWRVSSGTGPEARLEALSQAGGAPLECWLSDRPIGAEEAARITKALRHDDHVARTRAAWREWLARGAVVCTADSLVNQSYRAALVTLLQGHERSGSGWVPMGSPFQYRDTWLRDGARVVRALALGGFTDLAREDALTLARYQLPSGALLSQQGQLDGTGQALWAFEQAAGIPPSAEWSRRFLPFAQPAGRWLRDQRILLGMLARAVRVEWPDLMPFGDPRDGELVRGPLVGNDAWAIAGQSALASMAARAGDAGVRDAALAEGEAHRQAFVAALARVRHPDVPPSWSGAGRDWGNCYVGFPARALPESDPRLAKLAARIWGTSGLHLLSYGTADSLHSYIGTDLAVWALLAGRPADARAVLGDVLSHSSSTLGQSELFSRSTRSFGGNLPPHGTAAAQLVELVRDMVVMDVRDTLEIAAGGNLAWWAGTRVLRAPTRFGTMDVTLTRPEPGRLVARWSAVNVPLRVLVPDGVRLDSVEGAGTPDPGSRWVMCAAGQRELVMKVTPL